LTTTSDETELLELAEDLGTKLARLGFIFRRPLHGREVSVQRVRVLSSLLQGPMRVSQMAAEEDVTQPTMTSMVRGLERNGWVRRRPDATDGRVVLVTITPEGRKVVYTNRKLRTVTFAAQLAQLDPDIVRQLHDVVPKLDLLLNVFDPTDRYKR
jgi:DNA-binding MarR family transcriptional regulator